jgi:hypothetical protein
MLTIFLLIIIANLSKGDILSQSDLVLCDKTSISGSLSAGVQGTFDYYCTKKILALMQIDANSVSNIMKGFQIGLRE